MGVEEKRADLPAVTVAEVADVIRGAWEACGEVPFPLYDREAEAIAWAVLTMIRPDLAPLKIQKHGGGDASS